MTKYLILLAILIALYLYWKHQQNKTLPHNPDDIIERKGKSKEQSPNESSQIFYDANDFELSSDEDNK